MTFELDLNSQSLSEENQPFEAHVDVSNANVYGDTEKSVTESNFSTEVIIHPLISEEEIPKVGMLFDTLEEARQFYYNYANKVGFEPHIRNTNLEKNGRTPINQAIQCNRDGYRTKRNPVTQRSNMVSSANCKARIYVKLDTNIGRWRLAKVKLNHMHQCDPSLAWMFKRNRELPMHAKDVIERNDEAGIRPSKTFQALADEAGGRSNLGFVEKDVRNYISSNLRLCGDDIDAKELLEYFMRMKEHNPNFFYEIAIRDDNSLKHVFWADARSRAACEYFGDVVTFNTTYNINKYEMLFGSFVGVNHHGNSVPLGCALLGRRDEFI